MLHVIVEFGRGALPFVEIFTAELRVEAIDGACRLADSRCHCSGPAETDLDLAVPRQSRVHGDKLVAPGLNAAPLDAILLHKPFTR